MKKLMILVIVLVSLIGCASVVYSSDSARKALDNGEDLTGHMIAVDVDILEDNPFFGPTIRTENYMTFVTEQDRPEVDIGDTVTVTVLSQEYFMGAWIITYEY